MRLYHGTHDKNIQFINREIINYNTIGTWLTNTPENAKMYGKHIVSVTK